MTQTPHPCATGLPVRDRRSRGPRPGCCGRARPARPAIGRVLLAVLSVWLGWVAAATAHEVRPAYLQIDQTAPRSYNVLWKVPRTGDTFPDIEPQFDPAFTRMTIGGDTVLDGFAVRRFRLTGTADLAGTRIAIGNLARTAIDVLANVTLLDGARHTLLLQPAAPSASVPQAPTGWSVLSSYVRLGVEHILLGFDHLLFVLALILLTKGVGRLVKTITAFTVAHSITLSLAVLGIVRVPGPPVEAAIALSIMFLALEVLRTLDGEATLTARKPWLVAFTFGLLHGLGFAGALSRIGLPPSEIPLALAAFNIGVELGQLLFVAAALLAIRALGLYRAWPLAARRVPPYAIGAVSAFWVIERIWGFAA